MEITYDGEFLRTRNGANYRIQKIDEDEMILICAAFSAHNRRKQEKRVQELRDAGQVWIVKYMRYHCEETVEVFSLDEAVSFLLDGANSEQLAYTNKGSITCPDGRVIHGFDLYQLIEREENRRENVENE